MARYKMKAEGDMFEEQSLGSFTTMDSAALAAEEAEENDRYIGYELVLEDTLLHVDYFYSYGDWHKVVT